MNTNTTNMSTTKKESKPLFSIDWKKPYHCIIKITPDDAEKILEKHNEGNRFLRAAGSKYIAVQIRSGEWIEDHPQPICFSNAGHLIDGQHRIAGIVMAKQAVWASVRFGVDPNYIKYIDTGISRQLCDRVVFVENMWVNKTIAAMIAQRYAMTIKGKPSPELALSLYHEMAESYKAIAELRKSTRHLGTTIVCLAFADYHYTHGEEALIMYSELFKLTTDCQPAQALRNFLTTSRQRGTVQYPYIVSACLANHEGREVKVLRAASWR